MKKMLAVLLTVALVISSAAALAEPVTVKFAAQADPTPATQAVVDAFNASQADYKVEWVDMSNDSGAMREQLTTSLKAGSTEYDVISMDVVWAGEFAASGFIQPLDMMLEDAGLNTADFNAGSMASGLYNGKEYVLPFFPDLGLLYFRKDIVSEEDAAKLVAGTYTLDDLLAMAEKYMGQGGTTTGIVFQSSLYEGLICNANEFTANWKDIKGGLEMMKKFTTSKAVPQNILNYTEGETANSFIKGESVFARNWPYMWGSIKSDGTIKNDQVAVAPLPGGQPIGRHDGRLCLGHQATRRCRAATAVVSTDAATSSTGTCSARRCSASRAARVRASRSGMAARAASRSSWSGALGFAAR